MPPKKETLKDRKAREKAESAAVQQATDRQDFEISEDRARQQVELQARAEVLETMNEFYARLVAPASRLMVRRTEYDALRQQMQDEAGVSAERLLAMQDRFEHVQRANGELLIELAHLRTAARRQGELVKSEVARMRGRVDERLQACAADIEGRILSRRHDALECGQHLNHALEENMRRVLALIADCNTSAQGVTAILQEHSSLHSRIPRRIRSILLALDPTDLVLMLDTLSFEVSTLEYLLARYPPRPDDPFTNPNVL